MSLRKIYAVGGDEGYSNWMQGSRVAALEDADLVVFTGGEDVDPSLYNENKHATVYSNLTRDLYEQKQFNKAKALNKHIIGICRGSQFLCVMAGGILVQHQHNPGFHHKIKTYDGRELEITSTHHQAAYPWRIKNFQVLGWTNNISKYHLGGNGEEMVNDGQEMEIVYYPEVKGLGIQGHPEMMYKEGDPTIEYLRNLLNLHMENAL